MKTRLLSIIIILTGLMLWNEPALAWTGSTVEAGKYYYICNKKTGNFLSGGSTTLLSASSKPTMWIPTADGSEFTFKSDQEHRITYRIDGTKIRFEVTNYDSADPVKLTKQSDGTYLITHKGTLATYYLACNSSGSIDFRANTSADQYSYWYFISEEEFNQTIQPTFEFDIKANSSNANAGSVSINSLEASTSARYQESIKSSNVTVGLNITFHAFLKEGYRFAGWSEDAEGTNIVSENVNYETVLNNKDWRKKLEYTLYANFKKQESASKWTGETVEAKNYYLYNVGARSFMSYNGAYGTQLSLEGDNPRVLCGLEAGSDGKWKFNTHFNSTTNYGRYDVNVNNYVAVLEDNGSVLPFINANYGENNANTRTATEFTLTPCGNNEYLISCVVNSTTYYLYDKGSGLSFYVTTTAPTKDTNSNYPEGYRWKFISKTLRVATFNVDGLPEKIVGITINANGPGTEGTESIANYFKNSGVDVIAFQEDFNEHNNIHPILGKTETDYYHMATWKGKVTVNGLDKEQASYTGSIAAQNESFKFLTDGLELWTKNGYCSWSDETSVPWKTCYGWTGNGNDKMIEKGYRYYLITMRDGTQIDLYTMHMDADTDEGDLNAREDQLSQIADAILTNNHKRPIIVMGDTNCRYTRDRLKSGFIDVLDNDERFTATDCWIEQCKNGTYPYFGTNALMVQQLGGVEGEMVDKVIYVNNIESDVKLTSVRFFLDSDYTYDNTKRASDLDHWPLVVDFQYEPNTPVEEEVEVALEGEDRYLRNKETGLFLKSGGWRGAHATQGDYGTPVDIIAAAGENQYYLSTDIFNGVNSNGDELHYITTGDPYMDGVKSAWTITKVGDYYTLTFDDNGTTKALTAQSSHTFDPNYTPNKKIVETAPQNASDDNQLWEILTADDLMLEMLQATPENPFNCTHLLQGANFDRNDNERNKAWNHTVGKNIWGLQIDESMTNYVHLTGIDGLADGSFGNNPNYSINTDNYADHLIKRTNVWQLNHQFASGLPRGYYYMTWQGFYWESNLIDNNDNVKVSITLKGDLDNEANEGVTTRICNAYQSGQSTALNGGTGEALSSQNVYVPNSPLGASYYFNKGLYSQQSETFLVDDGLLSMILAKDGQTKTVDSWTCIDNFQLFYLGPEPKALGEQDYYLYNIDAAAFLGSGNYWGTQASLGAEKSFTDQKVEINYNAPTDLSWKTTLANGKYKITAGTGSAGLGITKTYEAFVDLANPDEFNITPVEGTDVLKISTVTANNGDANVNSNYANTYIGWSGEVGDTQLFPLIPQNDPEPRGVEWLLFSKEEHDSYVSYVSREYVTRLRHEMWPLVRSVRRTMNNEYTLPSYETFLSIWRNPSSTASALKTVAKNLKEDMLDLLENATMEKPVDMSFLLQGTDCSDLDLWDGGSSNFQTSTVGESYLRNTDVLLGRTSFKSVNGSTLSQTITNAPAGVYELALDIDEAGNADLYGEGDWAYSAFSENHDINVIETIEGKNAEKKSTVACAGTGYHTAKTPRFIVKKGEMTVGITTKGADVTFDNFKLRYVGPLRYIRSAATPAYPNNEGGNELYLFGTWRSGDQAEINEIIPVDNKITCVDITKATVPSELTFTNEKQHNNMLIYATASAPVTNTQNVVKDGTCANLVIDDYGEFAGNNGFTATNVTYSRTGTGKYNSVCLPYAVPYDQIATIFGSDAKVYTFGGYKKSTEAPYQFIAFNLVTSEDIPAGTPCLVETTNKNWSTAWENKNVAVAATAGNSVGTGGEDVVKMTGSFAEYNIGAGKYKVKSTGEYFVSTTSAGMTYPFRMFLEPGDVTLPSKLTFGLFDEWDNPTFIDAATIFNEVDGETYDVAGRRLPKNSQHKGVYIENGKKIVK